MKDILYDFIDNHHFTYGVNDKDCEEIDKLANHLDEKNIILSKETLELIFFSTNIVKQFVFYIRLLYLVSNEEIYSFINDQTYYNLFFTMYYGYDETMGYRYRDEGYNDVDPYLKNIFHSFREIDLSIMVNLTKKKIFYIIYKYYWFHRKSIPYEDLVRVVKEINDTEDEIFKLNGVCNDIGQIKVNKDNLSLFLEGLFKRGSVIK